jgi:hypothetical protein
VSHRRQASRPDDGPGRPPCGRRMPAPTDGAVSGRRRRGACRGRRGAF